MTGRRITLTVPLPPSVNKLYSRGGPNGVYKQAKPRRWITEAGWEVRRQLGPIVGVLFDADVAVDVQLPGTMRGDLDNRLKALLDLFTAMCVWRDDDQVADIRVRRLHGVTECVVVITALDFSEISK